MFAKTQIKGRRRKASSTSRKGELTTFCPASYSMQPAATPGAVPMTFSTVGEAARRRTSRSPGEPIKSGRPTGGRGEPKTRIGSTRRGSCASRRTSFVQRRSGNDDLGS